MTYMFSLNRLTSISESVFPHEGLRHVHPALTENIAAAVSVTPVQSRLYYANFFLFKTSMTSCEAQINLPGLYSTHVPSLLSHIHRLQYRLVLY